MTLGCAGILGVLLLAGCGGEGPGGGFSQVIGAPGHTSGKFNRPRGITYSPTQDVFFVVDWDGRIQKFERDGTFRASWRMPQIDNGKPEELCMTPRGTLLVADTHYNRIMEFDPVGRELMRFGTFGRKPGEFVYPVGICTDPQGHIYVCEYGENDRVQKFDAAGTFIKEWGSFGEAPGQFQRPAGLVFGDGHLYVADAANHRVQVFDAEGTLVRVIGSEGAEPGQFRYPYDVALRGGCLYVLEYGNHRVQKLSLEGKHLATFGGRGRGDGQFANPWRFAVVKDALYVSDTDNSRVVELDPAF